MAAFLLRDKSLFVSSQLEGASVLLNFTVVHQLFSPQTEQEKDIFSDV